MSDHKENITKIMLMYENPSQVISDYVKSTEKDAGKAGFKRGVYTIVMGTLILVALKMLLW